MTIPKQLHFIWAGGKKPLPEKNAAIIKEWAAKNSGFEVILWVDKKSTPPDVFELYKQQYGFNQDPKIILKDITDEGVADEYSRYHIDHLEPNYGASSDILRYAILAKYGGVYFDSDVLPGEKALNHDGLFDDTSITAALKINQFSQNSEAIGNDGFICTPGHPFMKDLYEKSRHSHTSITKDIYHNRIYDYGKEKAQWTIGCTGPHAVRLVCLAKGMIPSLGFEGNITTEDPEYMIDRSVFKPVEYNDYNWMKEFIVKKSLEEAIASAIESIHFEAKNMGYLLLDYHIENIVKSTGKDAETIAAMLTEGLTKNPPDITNVIGIQLLSKYQAVRDYYKQTTAHLFDNLAISPLSDLNIKAVIEPILRLPKDESIKIGMDYAAHILNNITKCYQTSPDTIEPSHLNQLLLAKIVLYATENTEKKDIDHTKKIDESVSRVLAKIIQNHLKEGNPLDALLNNLKEQMMIPYVNMQPLLGTALIQSLQSASKRFSDETTRLALSQMTNDLNSEQMKAAMMALTTLLLNNITGKNPSLDELLVNAMYGAISDPEQFKKQLKEIASEHVKEQGLRSSSQSSVHDTLDDLFRLILTSHSLDAMLEKINHRLSADPEIAKEKLIEHSRPSMR